MTPEEIMQKAGMPQSAIDANIAGINSAIKKGLLIDSNRARVTQAKMIARTFSTTRLSV